MGAVTSLRSPALAKALDEIAVIKGMPPPEWFLRHAIREGIYAIVGRIRANDGQIKTPFTFEVAEGRPFRFCRAEEAAAGLGRVILTSSADFKRPASFGK